MKKDKDNILYGKALRNLRDKNHLTQDDVAQLTGFDTKYISQVETGVYMGTIKTMLKFCEAFHVSPNDILADLINSTNVNNEMEKFYKDFSKLSKRDKENVYALIKSMLSN